MSAKRLAVLLKDAAYLLSGILGIIVLHSLLATVG